MEDDTPTLEQLQRKALLATQQASEAAAALALFAIEGSCDFAELHPFGDIEVVDILAEALHSALTIEDAHKRKNACGFGETLSSMGQLSAACVKYLSDVAGTTPDDDFPLWPGNDRACRICGCTQERGCVLSQELDDVETCAWAEPDLCSNPACLEKAKTGKSCTCAEVCGEDPDCVLHGRGTPWAAENPE